jgi:hypothetical protein
VIQTAPEFTALIRRPSLRLDPAIRFLLNSRLRLPHADVKSVDHTGARRRVWHYLGLNNAKRPMLILNWRITPHCWAAGQNGCRDRRGHGNSPLFFAQVTAWFRPNNCTRSDCGYPSVVKQETLHRAALLEQLDHFAMPAPRCRCKRCGPRGIIGQVGLSAAAQEELDDRSLAELGRPAERRRA